MRNVSLRKPAKLHRKKSAIRQELRRAAGRLAALAFGYVKGSFQEIFNSFVRNKQQFWPERLHILNKRGQNVIINN